MPLLDQPLKQPLLKCSQNIKDIHHKEILNCSIFMAVEYFIKDELGRICCKVVVFVVLFRQPVMMFQ